MLHAEKHHLKKFSHKKISLLTLQHKYTPDLFIIIYRYGYLLKPEKLIGAIYTQPKEAMCTA